MSAITPSKSNLSQQEQKMGDFVYPTIQYKSPTPQKKKSPTPEKEKTPTPQKKKTPTSEYADDDDIMVDMSYFDYAKFDKEEKEKKKKRNQRT